MTDPHPTSEELAAYLSSGLTEEERGRLEAHLAACAPCRTEVTRAHRLLETAPARGRRAMPLMAAGLAAAALLVILIRPPERQRPAGERLRASEPPASTITGDLVAPVVPAEDALVSPPLTFVWRAGAERPLHRLTLTDASGEVIWTTDTRDTVLTLPSSVPLTAGARYFWYLDAIGPDAGWTSSGPHSFRAGP